ncbi:MAG: substrate-binding domain-containing protein [Magnetococcales bacterium]|nr:substrate-binding domain-containing protein [Magnetococcales bacterium]
MYSVTSNFFGKMFNSALLVAAIWLIVGVGEVSAAPIAAAYPEQRLTIAGTGDSQPLLRLVAKYFEQDNIEQNIFIDVPDSIGSGGGILALKKGVAQLARTARPIKKREHNGLISIPFAISPIVFAVHPSVTWLDNLTSEQVLAIYSGKARNWSEFGGGDHKIYVVDRERGDSSLRILEKSFVNWNDKLQVGKVFYSTDSAAKAVAKHRFTIGYMPLSVALGYGLKVLTIDGIAPDESAVVSGQYPHILYFELVGKKPVTGWEKKFILYMFTPKIQRFMQKIGVYPIAGGLPTEL